MTLTYFFIDPRNDTTNADYQTKLGYGCEMQVVQKLKKSLIARSCDQGGAHSDTADSVYGRPSCGGFGHGGVWS